MMKLTNAVTVRFTDAEIAELDKEVDAERRAFPTHEVSRASLVRGAWKARQDAPVSHETRNGVAIPSH